MYNSFPDLGNRTACGNRSVKKDLARSPRGDQGRTNHGTNWHLSARACHLEGPVWTARKKKKKDERKQNFYFEKLIGSRWPPLGASWWLQPRSRVTSRGCWACHFLYGLSCLHPRSAGKTKLWVSVYFTSMAQKLISGVVCMHKKEVSSRVGRLIVDKTLDSFHHGIAIYKVI